MLLSTGRPEEHSIVTVCSQSWRSLRFGHTNNLQRNCGKFYHREDQKRHHEYFKISRYISHIVAAGECVIWLIQVRLNTCSCRFCSPVFVISCDKYVYPLTHTPPRAQPFPTKKPNLSLFIFKSIKIFNIEYIYKDLKDFLYT